MKILFATFHSEFLDNEYVFPYLGVLTLLGVAAKTQKVKIVWQDEILTPELRGSADVFYVDNIKEPLTQYDGFDVYCFSVFTPQYSQALKLLRRLRDANSSSKFIIGGSHATYYSDIIKTDGWDLVVVGEGERVIARLISGELDFSNKVICETLKTGELFSYPIPYRRRGHLLQYKYHINGRAATTLVSARGCPRKCAFCESRLSTCRRMDVKRFEAEVVGIVEDCLFPNIMIFDDIFALSPEILSPYAAVLKSMNRKFNAFYRCFVHADIILRNPSMVEMLKDSGCVEVGFGAESAADEILKNVFKGNKVSDYELMIKAFVDAGIRVKAFFMLGLPGETEETATKTKQFINAMLEVFGDMFDFDCTVFFPYRGTFIGDSVRAGRKEFDLRLSGDYSWERVDSGMYGAYKTAKGHSDIVVESYDHSTQRVLYSADQIREMQESIMKMSRRYK